MYIILRNSLAWAALCTIALGPAFCLDEARAARAVQSGRAQPSVYDRQAPVSEKELLAFLEILPRFRVWARENNEEAHPILRNGKADFLYSEKAGQWVSAQGWQVARFFCVMGRMAAAMVIVEEGNDMRGTRPRDMPDVSKQELELAKRHMGAMLTAGGHAPPIRAE
ncbi:MAG: serine/threonine protein phosphatase [Desulfovibrio sp.]|nr:serine/threonine protein phosphatase [Desulfovibrio sp.]